MLSRLWKTAFGKIVMKVWIYARSPVVNDINREKSVGSIPSIKSPTGTINAVDEYHDDCGWKHPHCQQDQVSHRPLRQPCDADLLLVWPLLLLPSPRHGHGLFGDGRLPNWLQFLRPSWLTWIAKREAVRLPSRLQFIDRLGRPGLRNAKLFGFPSGCSFLDREHDLRKILIIRHQIHSTKNFWEWNSNWLLASLIEMIRRWDGAACMIVFTWTVMIVVFVDLVAVFRGVNFGTRGHAWRYVSRRTAAHTRTFGAVWTRS